MKVQISKISIFQTSRIIAILYAFMGLIHFSIGFFMLLFGKPEGFILILTPIFMGALGFIFFAVLSAIYNWISTKFGGIEFELTHME